MQGPGKSIRLRWRADVVHAASGSDPHASQWTRATAENEQDLNLILREALVAYGPASHWIEEKAPDGSGGGLPDSAPGAPET